MCPRDDLLDLAHSFQNATGWGQMRVLARWCDRQPWRKRMPQPFGIPSSMNSFQTEVCRGHVVLKLEHPRIQMRAVCHSAVSRYPAYMYIIHTHDQCRNTKTVTAQEYDWWSTTSYCPMKSLGVCTTRTIWDWWQAKLLELKGLFAALKMFRVKP